MWEYRTIQAYNLIDLSYQLNGMSDWELLATTESRHPSDPDTHHRMWWSSFEALLKRKKTDELA